VLTGRVVVVAGDLIDLAGHLRDLGATVEPMAPPFDARDEVAARLAAIADRTGGVDVVVHAHLELAALTPADVTRIDDAAWDRQADAHLRAALFVAQAAFVQLRDRGGRIVFVTSTGGLLGEARFVAHTTAGEGVRALAKSAARQWGAHGITVNCVAVPLPMLGADLLEGVEPPALGRPATARDVAGVIALLGSDNAGAITGATIPVDGGVVMIP